MYFHDTRDGQQQVVKEGQSVDYTRKHCTYIEVSLFTSAEPLHTLGSRFAQHLSAPEKNLSYGPRMFHPLLISHFTSTSSSSFTLFFLPRHQNTHYRRDNKIYYWFPCTSSASPRTPFEKPPPVGTQIPLVLGFSEPPLPLPEESLRSGRVWVKPSQLGPQ